MSLLSQLPDSTVGVRLKLDEGGSCVGEVINLMPNRATLMLSSSRSLATAVGCTGRLSFTWAGETLFETPIAIEHASSEGMLRMCSVRFTENHAACGIGDAAVSSSHCILCDELEDCRHSLRDSVDASLSWQDPVGISSRPLTVTKIGLGHVETAARAGDRALPPGVEEFELTINLPMPIGVLSLKVKPIALGIEGRFSFGAASGSPCLGSQLLCLWVLRSSLEPPAPLQASA